MIGFFRWLLGGDRRRASDIPDESWAQALEKHPIVRVLSAEQTARLRARTGEVLSRISIDTARGVDRGEELRLSVALQAALPVLELGVVWYRAIRTILLVPGEYETELTTVDEAGVVHEGVDTISGETGPQQPVVLSVADVEASGWGEGYNVVIHEMAHVIDAADGEADGIPPLPTGIEPGRWSKVFAAVRSDHERRVRRSERGGAQSRATMKPPVLDPYAAEGPEEFFACSAELFFERPRRLKRAYPELFEELRAFFGFDPSGLSGE
ncbi:MAG: Zn-dependent hydrolase [Spirochaetes bacterium]|jgi:Mlc titration factor MtfA (ptsG expression regulator)|nr:Zn-dependent hydrolase [Spirochaetota bacterium]